MSSYLKAQMHCLLNEDWLSLLVSIFVENDGHVCQVKSFGYTNHHVELEADADAVDLTYYAPSGEWNLLGTWAEEVKGINYSEVSHKENGRKREPFTTTQLYCQESM